MLWHGAHLGQTSTKVPFECNQKIIIAQKFNLIYLKVVIKIVFALQPLTCYMLRYQFECSLKLGCETFGIIHSCNEAYSVNISVMTIFVPCQLLWRGAEGNDREFCWLYIS